ncbi:hypothetical protein SNOD_33855 [Streptomyces nodosus]|uniref:Uncharacterized protein n=1 Tax=Streptomyces nodosus TaxID=40318 RepID=A0A0B5DW08_9ACTN|nr:hypothetical protein SNOD_33855 [Streptomyces nodosus]
MFAEQGLEGQMYQARSEQHSRDLRRFISKTIRRTAQKVRQFGEHVLISPSPPRPADLHELWVEKLRGEFLRGADTRIHELQLARDRLTHIIFCIVHGRIFSGLRVPAATDFICCHVRAAGSTKATSDAVARWTLVHRATGTGERPAVAFPCTSR